MPRSGPWITPSPLTFSLDQGVVVIAGNMTSTPSGALLSERHGSGAVDAATGGFPYAAENLVGVGGLPQVGSRTEGRPDLSAPSAWESGQIRVAVGWNSVHSAYNTAVFAPLLSPPPGAVAVEFQTTGTNVPPPAAPSMLTEDTTLAWVAPTNPAEQGTWSGTGLTYDLFHPVADVLELHTAGATAWGDSVPGAAMSSATLLGATTTPTTLDVNVSLSTVAGSSAWRDTDIPFGLATDFWLNLVLAYQSQRTHADPPWGGFTVPSGAGFTESYGATVTAPSSLRLDGAISLPTYRWLFAGLPRMRQYPRDDYLGSAPRQGTANGSRSVQASSRQGWRNTYR